MTKDAYYFPHFANARYDRKIRRLRKQLGIEGYGIYFMILETLREQTDFSYPIDDVDLLADDFGTSTEKVLVVIKTDGLFLVTEDRFFYSPKLVEFLSPYLEAKQRNRLNGIKGNLIKYNHATKEELDNLTNDEILALNESKRDLSGGDRGAVASKVKKRKVNQSKVNKEESDSIEPEVVKVEDELAELLLESICKWDNTHKYNHTRPALKAWAKDIDRAMRIDKRTREQMEWMINYLFLATRDATNGFWAPNIQSGGALRNQFDKIKNQIKTNQNRHGKSVNQKRAEAEQFLNSYRQANS